MHKGFLYLVAIMEQKGIVLEAVQHHVRGFLRFCPGRSLGEIR